MTVWVEIRSITFAARYGMLRRRADFFARAASA